MAQIENKAVSREANPDISRPMESPFTEDGVDQISAIPLDEGESVLLEDSFAPQSESRLPEWFNPGNLSVSAGLGYSIDSSDDYLPEKYERNNSLSGTIGLNYGLFGVHSFLGLEFGPYLAYRGIASTEGHEVQAGISASIEYENVRFGTAVYYYHAWMGRVDCDVIADPPWDTDSTELICKSAEADGMGFRINLDYVINDHFGLGAYLDIAGSIQVSSHYNHFSDYLHITPGLQAVVDF